MNAMKTEQKPEYNCEHCNDTGVAWKWLGSGMNGAYDICPHCEKEPVAKLWPTQVLTA